jgi:hypothetical protein
MGVFSEMYGDDILEHPLIYRGVVENVDDPEKAGRVKVRVLGVHSDNPDYVQTEHLPWAIPATDLRFGGGLRNIGSYKVPDTGSHVFVFFEAGDHNFPVYFAAAPAIEDVEDYQEKDGKFDENKYQYSEESIYDDKSNYDDKLELFKTPKDDKIKHPVQDYAPQTRKNTFNDGGSEQIPPPKKDEDDNQPIFPSRFFVQNVRVAFDGKANLDAPNYNGIFTIRPSFDLNKVQEQQELDLWSERKWGYNDDDAEHQHDFDGGTDWKPEYPMCSTERNAQGEIIDRDILKERMTYVHPSKYFTELIQLDSTREKDDFLNERSIKKVYERQRGKSNSPDEIISVPHRPPTEAISNSSDPIKVEPDPYEGRLNNEIIYDGKDGSVRGVQRLSRFEERKHNPGREKTVVEDFVYRYYANKVNETFNVDRNTRIYTGNDNMEIEHGDRNYRLHRGSHNQHLDIGNYNRTVNKGWVHTHIDDGHHFIELNGSRQFSTAASGESDIKMDGSLDYQNAQHTESGVADSGGLDQSKIVNGTTSFDQIGYAETARGSQFFLLNPAFGDEDANQTFRLRQGNQLFHMVEGNQTFQLSDGDQGFYLEDGHQYFLLDKGDQKFELTSGDQTFILSNGDLYRRVNGKRDSLYTDTVLETSNVSWTIIADQQIKLAAPSIIFEGNVTINGNETVTGNQFVAGTCTGPTNQA